MRQSEILAGWARCFAAFGLVAAGLAGAGAQENPASGSAAAGITRAVGTIKSIQVDTLTVSADSGGEVTVKLQPSTKIVRVPPGEKDLKNAIPLEPEELGTGDRVLLRGQTVPDGHAIAALSVIVMKQSDVSAKQQRDRDDWQKRGVGGLVSTVDPAGSTITISSEALGAAKTVTIHTTKDTVLRRYASTSVKFDDAKPAPLDQIKPGDQLRARGARSEDRSQLTAEEIVSGTFVNIAGTVAAVDAATNTLSVKDTIRKGLVDVKFSPDSQIKRLPPEFAQRIAMRLKAASNSQDQPSSEVPSGRARGTQATGMVSSPATPGTGGQFSRGPGGGAGSQGGGPPDFQRFLNRLPSSTLADLHKGDAVMIVSVPDGSLAVTVITLLAGVEPILTVAPSTLLTPWSLGSSQGEGEAGR
jgi:hypothetical protein